ncbi:XRE family transcriptional regulator [Merismopedia glauca]|uniref:Transcriptional regulator n=1 Tax=Merismopedia glauca CCAP 1448/3 TaxID=1296344 RepID=A0A2T1C2Z1_9CYAN|nr:XRE family transcriptional regulator [Merismopedia glauca]PSB02622.1 transcriptional regulator [Merismopedia glauca CCAP 1448/3]
MSGHHKFSQLIEQISEERQVEIAQKTAQLKAEMALSELRQALQLSQTELAAKLQIKQPAVSRLEKRTDMYVSHLRKVIEAMGGELDIIARFPDGEVKVNNFSDL